MQCIFVFLNDLFAKVCLITRQVYSKRLCVTKLEFFLIRSQAFVSNRKLFLSENFLLILCYF